MEYFVVLHSLMTLFLLLLTVSKQGEGREEKDLDDTLLFGGLMPLDRQRGRGADISPIQCHCAYPPGAIRYLERRQNRTSRPCWRGTVPVKTVACSSQLGCFNLTIPKDHKMTKNWTTETGAKAVGPFIIRDCFWRRRDPEFHHWTKDNDCKDTTEGKECICNYNLCNSNSSPLSLSLDILLFHLHPFLLPFLSIPNLGHIFKSSLNVLF